VLSDVRDGVVEHQDRKKIMAKVLKIAKSVEQRLASTAGSVPPVPHACSCKRALKKMCLSFAHSAEQSMTRIEGRLTQVATAVDKLERCKNQLVLKHEARDGGKDHGLPDQPNKAAVPKKSQAQLQKLRDLLQALQSEHQNQRTAYASLIRQQEEKLQQLSSRSGSVDNR